MERTQEAILYHYELEKRLASQLLSANKQERKVLYTELYEELLQSVPYLTAPSDSAYKQKQAERQVQNIQPFLSKQTSFLELGPGDCSVSLRVARLVKQVYAVDVSPTITQNQKTPDNFHLIISDGTNIPVPPHSIDFVYSNQLMEHLHPDDAYEQMQNVLSALVPNGIYLCMTPSRLNGPHDVSKYFDDVATGFHLKEYTITDLNRLFKEVGFSKVKILIGARGRYIKASVTPSILLEKMLSLLPASVRKKIMSYRIVNALVYVRLIGIK